MSKIALRLRTAFWMLHRFIWRNCWKFFEENAGNKDVANALRSRGEKVYLAFERMSASRHSPGRVIDREVLLRQVFEPVHIDEAGETLKPTAFDDASDKGLSVDRGTHRDAALTIEEGQTRAASALKPRSLRALTILVVEGVRSITAQDGSRVFGVYDTALKNNRAHADVIQLVSGKQAGRSARSKLLDLASQNLKLLK